MSVEQSGAVLEVRDLHKTYGAGDSANVALRGLTFEVAADEFVAIVGPSGCGKTTLLKCVSGLLAPTSGKVLVKGRTVEAPPPEMGVVFQDYSRSLFPWMTVRENVRFPLRRRSQSKKEREQRVEHAVASVGLAHALDRYPWELSGGMQQRISIARALAYQPSILLMDEPFASVDAQTRSDLEDLVLRVRDEYQITIVFVTHDIDESVYLSDRVVVLSGPPTSLKNAFDVDLPRPRGQISTKEMPEYVRLRSQVYRAIRSDDAVEAGLRAAQ